MEQTLLIYNTLTRKKEAFKSINPGHVGMYVCGPTVYGDAHLGHARPAITFDILFRYLQHIGYKVRYVRNITDVGHLEHDADEGEDKIAKKARLEQVEPMQIAQYYTRRFNAAMEKLNVLSPSIEPHATGHIIEQQQLVQEILDNGYAYISNGSVYFDIEKYNNDFKYGILSGRTLENIKDASRDTLAGVGEKKNQADFALWKKAQPEHIMRWPWLMPVGENQETVPEEGFPGWHLECSTMGEKYLGEEFDAHISGIASYGIYCEIDDNHCEGMVPLRDLDDDYYDFDEKNYCLVGRRRHNRYQLGDSVRIKVARANVERRQLDFTLIS